MKLILYTNHNLYQKRLLMHLLIILILVIKSGKKRSNKDSTIEKIKKSSIGEEIQDVSLLSFYDLFFNEYKIKKLIVMKMKK